MEETAENEIDPEELKFKMFSEEFIDIVNDGIDRTNPPYDADDLSYGILESLILKIQDKENLLKYIDHNKIFFVLYDDVVQKGLEMAVEKIKLLKQEQLIEIYNLILDN